jgi:hypothetical protein
VGYKIIYYELCNRPIEHVENKQEIAPGLLIMDYLSAPFPIQIGTDETDIGVEVRSDPFVPSKFDIITTSDLTCSDCPLL